MIDDYRLMAVGCCLLIVGWSLVVGYLLMHIDCWLVSYYCCMRIVGCLRIIIGDGLSVVGCFMFLIVAVWKLLVDACVCWPPNIEPLLLFVSLHIFTSMTCAQHAIELRMLRSSFPHAR